MSADHATGADEVALNDYLLSAIDIVKEAGFLVRDAFLSPRSASGNFGGASDDNANGFHVSTKESPTDLVTETDRKCESLIFGRLRARWPHCRFIGEETSSNGVKHPLTDDPTWIVDPIDGTTNFVHGYQQTCIAVGLAINKEPVVGVVFNPITNEIFSAAKGHGAFLNGSIRLPTIGGAAPSQISSALVATEFGSSRTSMVMEKKLGAVRRMLAQQSDGGGEAQGLRSIGTAATNMCEVARGGFDLYWEFGVHCWDIAGATVIVREAGGRVITLEGRWKDNRKGTGNVCDLTSLDLMARSVISVRKGEDSAVQTLIGQATSLIEHIAYDRD